MTLLEENERLRQTNTAQREYIDRLERTVSNLQNRVGELTKENRGWQEKFALAKETVGICQRIR